MKPNNKISGEPVQQFMRKDGVGGPCIISDEISKIIAEDERITLHQSSPMSESKRKEISNDIIASRPEGIRGEVEKKLNEIDVILGKTAPNAVGIVNSKCYIIVRCTDDADPKFNRLQLRTDPPTFIELNPGENILTVEQYPALKYGFKQIDETDIPQNDIGEDEELLMSILPEENCQEVIEVDFSHFDGSNLTSMEEMFFWMYHLEKIEFGNLNTSNVTSMISTFDKVGCGDTPLKTLDLSNLDLSNVKDASYMFFCAEIETIHFPKLCSLEKYEHIFEEGIFKKIIFDDSDDYDLTPILYEILPMYNGDIVNVALRGNRSFKSVRDIVLAVEEINDWAIKDSNRFEGPILSLDLGSKWKAKVKEDEDGDDMSCLVAQISRGDKLASRIFDIREVVSIIKRDSNCISLVSLTNRADVINDYIPEQVINQGETGRLLVSVKDTGRELAFIPYGITDIGRGAFKDCLNLKYVVLPDSVVRIHDYAFAGCHELKGIHIPDSVRYIGDRVFQGCKKLKHLYIPNGVRYIGSMGDSLFSYVRIPHEVWKGFTCRTNNLVIGLPEMGEFSLDSLNYYIEEGIKIPAITLEPYGATQGWIDDNVRVINGMVLTCYSNALGEIDEYEELPEVYRVESIPSTSLAIPDKVNVIGACHAKVPCLYIPESVERIDNEAFDEILGFRDLPIFITKASNLNHLIGILPVQFRDVIICTI